MKYAYMILILSIVMLSACKSTINQTVCTTDAKLCPDGSAVGRTGPNCTFPDCPVTGKLKAIDCPENRTNVCTREYVPVCGQVQVECIRAPCPPIMQTFDNKCEACANPLTISYMKGACQDNSATVPAGNSSEQCQNIGGSWTGYDCEGLSAGQCQEIGGTFDECASACRNDPTAQICTLQCVPICKL